MQHTHHHPSSFAAAVAFLALALVACGGEDATAVEQSIEPLAPTPSPGAEPPAASDAPPASEDDEPQFLLHSAVQGDDGGRLNYFTPVSSLATVATVSYDGSLELPGRARLYAAPGVGHFAIGDAEGVSLQRYELIDGRFVPGAELSLQAFGVTSLGAQAVLFASPTRAYYKDAGQGLIIAWNPRDMLIDEVIELPPSLIREGYVLGLSNWVQRDAEAFFAVSWSTPEYDRVLPGTALVRLDLTTNAIDVTLEPRCRGIETTAHVDGSLYFFSDVINGFGHAVYPDDAGQRDCILRVAPGSSVFDPEYLGSISEALPPGTSGTVAAVTDDGE